MHGTNLAYITLKIIKVNSCTDLAKNGITTDGYYDLDFGQPQSPVTTWCTLPDGETKLGEDIEINVEHCSSNKCFSKDLEYEANQEQFDYLIESSKSCYQNLSFHCVSSPLQVRILLPKHLNTLQVFLRFN